jgi:hypothetical protein
MTEEHPFHPLKVNCPADIFRNIDMRVSQDLITILTHASDTTRAKLRQLIDRMDYEGLGKFVIDELNHYRWSRNS